MLLICFTPIALAQGPAAVPITILHMNDLHGHITPYLDKSLSDTIPSSGAPYFAAIIQRERAANPDGTLLLAAGDMFQGTPLSDVFKGKPVIEVMNRLSFDAMTLGNHEFDWGREALSNLISQAAFPFLSCNIRDPQGQTLPGARPHVILSKNGLKVAVIGITTPETYYSTKPDNVTGLAFLDPAEVLPDIIKDVKARGADLVILLSHLGLDDDKIVAQKVSGIDVIVGGHSHTVMIDPLLVGSTIIVQAGYYGLYVGVLKLQVDKATHKITSFTRENELKQVTAGPDDPRDETIAKMVDNYAQMIEKEFSKVVGSTSVDLVRKPYEESNIGDLVCDAMKESAGVEVAFQNGGGIRADLPKGEITLDEMYTLLPFDNVLVLMTLSGAQIAQVLEKNGALETKILQVSGITVEYNLNKPLGSRVAKALVGGAPLDAGKDYRVVTNDFLAAGGDQFTTFKKGRNIVYGSSLRDAVIAYLRTHSPVSRQGDNRIVFVK
jgi:2',3'-cyclic-nucleotide 2'-phosphodiesterase (5'-nucleotidase family)